jgi:uncharacterized protein DUF397
MSLFVSGTPADLLGAVQWRKSSKSWDDMSNSNCVEVAVLPDGQIGMRNSRDLGGPALVYTRDEWAAFLTGVMDGEFDDLAV